MRLSSFAIGGSLVTIAALVTAIPAPQTSALRTSASITSENQAASPWLQSGAAGDDQMVEPQRSDRYQELPSVYPLRLPLVSTSTVPSVLPKRPPGEAANQHLYVASARAKANVATEDAQEIPLERSKGADSLRVAQKSSTVATPLNLTLQDVVILALENNRDIKNAYLNRIIERESLRVA